MTTVASRMGTDDTLKSYPITDLLKLERREELVPRLLFAKGVTTFVTPSGGGKTTLCLSMGLYVSAALWGDEEVKQRPMFWIAGQDHDGLRAIFEAWTKHNPDLCPDARFLPEAIDFSKDDQVNWLIKHLEGTPPPLIIADALSDILALSGLDEDRSKDVANVYKGIWQVVEALNAAFVMLHHSGWDERRERGSSAIRDNSHIVVKIAKFDAEAGVVRLEHLKRRSGAGPKLKEFYLKAKLIAVNGYSEPIPIVTGPKPENIVQEEPTEADARHARTLVAIMVQYFPNGAIRADLQEQSGMKASTFNRGHSYAVRKTWLVKHGKLYRLNPDAPWKNPQPIQPQPIKKPPSKTLPPSLSSTTPYRGVEVEESVLGASIGSKLEASWKLEQSASCKNGDATASAGNFNENNEGEDLVTTALKHVADKKSRWR